MRDKQNRGLISRAEIVAAVALIGLFGALIGCGGSGSDNTGSTTSGATTSTNGSTNAGGTTANAGGTGSTILAGQLPNNVIFYGDEGNTIANSNYDLHYISPDGSANALYASIPAAVTAVTPNPNVAGQVIFAYVDPTTTNVGIYENTALTTTGAKVVVSPQYTFIDSVTITPDNHTIIYSAQDANGNSTVYTVSTLPGGTPNALDSGDLPSLDPTGKIVVYQKDASGGTISNIWTINIDGSNQTQVTNDSNLDEFPQYNKAGTLITFCSNPNSGSFQIFTVKTDGTSLNPVTTDQTINQFGPSFNSDGTQISYSGLSAASDDTVNGIYTTMADGSTATTPTFVIAVAAPTSGTYWTGTNGRSTHAWKMISLFLEHKKKGQAGLAEKKAVTPATATPSTAPAPAAPKSSGS